MVAAPTRPSPQSAPLVPKTFLQPAGEASRPAVTNLAAADTAPPLAPVPVPTLAAPYSMRWRMGIAVPDGRSPAALAWPNPRPGWYLNWSVGYTATTPVSHTLTLIDLAVPPDVAVGMAFVPLVWVNGETIAPSLPLLAQIVSLLPGRTWLIGNEPDVRWQGNATPEQYARAYHHAYTTIKAADPTAQVAIGGISQVTPLRLAYLDVVWAAYREQYSDDMPVDVWNMHAFVLQEKAGEWGVGLPPGLATATATGAPIHGELWTVDQHDDLALVEAQVWRMRRWMQAHGQQDKPLWITEYGILMPPEYGYSAERVRAFMLGSFDLFLNLRDSELGYAADEGRLVQRWVWFSTDDLIYPTGNLFSETGQPTGLMAGYAAYLSEFEGRR